MTSEPSSPNETADAAVRDGGVPPQVGRPVGRPGSPPDGGSAAAAGRAEPTAPAPSGPAPATAATGGRRGRLRRALPGPEQLRAYWLSPPGLVMLAATLAALSLRLYLLSRPGYLTGVTEYDDGVYLGAAIRLLQGALPYRDFAFVQPPGIALLMAPVALLSKLGPTTHAMAAARLVTVLASAACVPLAGSLVRYRGVFVTLVTCGLLAVYPDDITTAHTLILEPWMNLLLLAGCCLAFRRGRPATPRRLLWAGVAIGFAGAVKYWAALPAIGLLAVCLLTRSPSRAARAKRYTAGVVAGFAVPVLPFFAAGPGLYVRSTLLDQATRTGTWVSPALRLAHITGFIDFLNARGHLTPFAGRQSLFAATPAAVPTVGAAPYLVTAALVALLAVGYLWEPRRPSPLEWYVLGTFTAVVTVLLGYSAFFYHYADFAAPWLAMSAGCAAGTLCARFAARPQVRAGLIGGVAVLAAVTAAFQASELSALRATSVYPQRVLIPAGACVVSDEISLTIAANRFTAAGPGCPDVLDALATTLVKGNGISVQGGAMTLPRVVSDWREIFSRAQWVWLSRTSGRRIPWTTGLRHWFGAHFRRVDVRGHAKGLGLVYEQVTPPGSAGGLGLAGPPARAG